MHEFTELHVRSMPLFLPLDVPLGHILIIPYKCPWIDTDTLCTTATNYETWHTTAIITGIQSTCTPEHRTTFEFLMQMTSHDIIIFEKVERTDINCRMDRDERKGERWR